MKGFIKVTEISLERVSHRDSLGFEDSEILKQEYPQDIAISNIKRVVPKGYRGKGKVSLILDEIYNGENVVITIKETYEEIKQKIKEVTTEFEDFENRPYSKLCYECRQLKKCEIKQKYRDGSLFACGSFVNKK